MATKLLTFHQLKELGVFYSREHIRRLVKIGAFPQPLQLSESRIAWLEDDVIGWIESRAALRDPETVAA